MKDTPTDNDPRSSLQDLLADAVDAVAPSVVTVQVGRRHASGTVWSASGLILTTARAFGRDHAEDAAPDVHVTLPGGEAVAAELVGRDHGTDLALLRLTDVSLTEPTWADPGVLRVGHFVAPIGRHTGRVQATFGVVQDLNGPWISPQGGGIDRFIEVDGSLPRGFSGGPLIGLDGAVIGVNTRGLVRGGTTLPRATIARVVEALLAHGTAQRGFLGVGVQSAPLPEAVAAAAGQARGLLVTWVGASSAAARAELMIGDTLLAVDGQATETLPGLFAALGGKAGVEVELRYVRAGAVETARATVDAAPQREEHGGPRHGHGGHRGHGDRGRHGHERGRHDQGGARQDGGRGGPGDRGGEGRGGEGRGGERHGGDGHGGERRGGGGGRWWQGRGGGDGCR